MDRSSVIRRVATAAAASAGPAFKATRFLVTLMVPVSLAAALLRESGAVAALSCYVDPFLRPLGLSGASLLVFASSVFANTYAALAAAWNLGLGRREMAAVAVMCVIAHNLFVEGAALKKTGSSAFKMAFLRLGAAALAAWVMNLLRPSLPDGYTAPAVPPPVTLDGVDLPALFGSWGLKTFGLVAVAAVLSLAMRTGRKVVEEVGLVELMSRIFAPVLPFFGLPSSSAYPFVIANVYGIKGGAPILAERTEAGKSTLLEGDLLNHHVAVSHSLIEDTLLFMAAGVSVFWLLVPRVLLAVAATWIERGRRILFRRSFRVGTI